MVKSQTVSISPTVSKVLDEYIAVLQADEEIDDEVADRLNVLLRTGKAPKLDDIDAALFPLPRGDKP